MLNSYDDIRSRIPESPRWWDENGVPRYVPFTPDETADIYAQECALVLIACQSCGAEFLVAFSWPRIGFVKGAPITLTPLTLERVQRLHYGDPPNVGCCMAGSTMNCDDLRVLEFWRKGGDEFTEERDGMRVCLPGYFDWRRVPELEISLTASSPETPQ
jgi:hypothetical protein